MVALPSREDIALCRECIEWLAARAGVVSTPTLPVVDMTEAVEFYSQAGFEVRMWTDEGEPGGFAFVEYDGQSVFDLGSEPIDPERNGAGCYLITKDADDWHGRMAAAGLPVSPIEDQSYGMRDFTLTDPSGNRIRIGRSIG